MDKFRREFEKTIAIFEISTFEYIKYKVQCKTKKPGFWNQKCLIWVLLVQNLKKPIAIFEINTFKFDKIKSFVLKRKNKFGIKIAFFGYFWTEIGKNLLHLKSAQSTLSKCNVSCKTKKNFEYRTENFLFD